MKYWPLWLLLAIAVIAAMIAGPSLVKDAATHQQAKAAMLAAKQADIARIAALNHVFWSKELLGKPDDYLFALGTTRYERIPENRIFGMPGVARVMQDKGGHHIWLTLSNGTTISWISPALQEVPAK